MNHTKSINLLDKRKLLLYNIINSRLVYPSARCRRAGGCTESNTIKILFILGKEVAAMLLKKLKSKQGISLPLAMAITSVLIILSASLIAIAATSIMSTSSSVNSRQAYLNVRSALEYAYAYYSDSSCVPDLTKVNNEYMVMNDKEGGTTAEGAAISNATDAEDYTTYVIANYIAPDGTRDVASLKLTAYSKSSDAFGKRAQTIHMAAIYNVNKLTNKNRVTLTDIDMDTDVLQYNTVRDAITLHCKQYPGENWTPFYYLWTYHDEAELYSKTSNCYGLEAVYKSMEKNPDFIYYKNDGTSAKVLDGFNTNENDSKNLLAPQSVWHVESHNQDDPRNGTTSYFAPTGVGGWHEATYYIQKDQVNYFNIIITAKGKVLNTTHGLETDNVQTNEMFHLWFLNNTDRNIYFEFLKPGMKYVTGAGWNGLQELQDRMLVYVNNQKTAVHFKVKGTAETAEQALDPKLDNPVISDIRIGGVPIYQTDHTYDSFSSSVSDVYYGVGSLENQWRESGLSTEGRGDMKDYFYGIEEDGQSKMIYEGCGWWVTNVETTKTFQMTLTYRDKDNNAHTGSVNVTPNSDNEAFVVVDLDRPAILSRLTETKANELIGVDDDSYTTIHVKSSEIGNPIAPYLDYKEMNVSSSNRRKLLEKIIEGQGYQQDDYEEDSFKVLSKALDEGVALYNEENYIQNKISKLGTEEGVKQANKDYDDMTTKIDDAIKNLRTKYCNPDVYAEFEKLVAEGDKIKEAQEESKIYKHDAYEHFIAPNGVYVKDKALKDSGEILTKVYDADVYVDVNKVDEEGNTVYDASGNPVTEKVLKYKAGDPVYTTSVVYQIISELKKAIEDIKIALLNKTDLNEAISEGETYINNSRYVQEYRDVLKSRIETAKDVQKNSDDQTVIDNTVTSLRAAIDDVKNHAVVSLNTAALSNLINQAKTKLDPTKARVNCTDESYKALKEKKEAAEAVFDNADATQADVDAAYDALLEAYNNFEIIKPSVSASINSKTTDALRSENKIRVWIRGMNVDSVIDGYYDDTDKLQYNEYKVVSFTLDEYLGSTSRGTVLNSEAATKIEKQDLSYFDIPEAQSNGYKISLVVVHYVYGDYNPSTGTYAVIDSKIETFSTDKIISIADVTDGNAVLDFKKLTKTNGITAEGKATVTNTLYMETRKLSELYIKTSASTSVEVYKSGTTPTIYPTLKEGTYQVARFIYDSDQTAVVKTYVSGSNEYVYSNAFDVSSGQYVVTFDEASKTDASILKLNVPYTVGDISGNRVTKIEAVAGTTSYPLVYDGQYFVLETKFTSALSSLKIVRHYVDSEGTAQTSESNSLSLTSAGEFTAVYSNETTVSSFTTKPSKFYNENVEQLSVTKIYPIYSSTSGSGSTVSAAQLDGLISDSIVSNVLTTPLASSVLTTTTFDFFGQSGVNSIPTKNTGTTIIWIDATEENPYLYNKGQLLVYVWDENDQALNGAWPGREPIRVDETDYYYVAVPSTCYGCIVSYIDSKGNKHKAGNDEHVNKYDGNIYFDICDVWGCWFNVTVGGQFMPYLNAYPKRCSIPGQGHSCLFEVINAAVMSGEKGYSYGVQNGDGNDRWNCYYDNTPKAPGKTAKIDFKDGKQKYGSYKVYSNVSYYYRAKRTDKPPTYEYDEPVVDTSDMTATDLRMAFVGGTKIRMENISYWYTQGPMWREGRSPVEIDRYNSSHSLKISSNNFFGGDDMNANSGGRVGDTRLTIVYDWYEYKIPVDKTNDYAFQLKGLKYNTSYVAGRGTQKWYDNDYRTDKQYTVQIQGVYGDIWTTMNDVTTVEDGRLTNMVLYTQSPETIQVEDNQSIYFRLPSGWPSTDLKVTAIGVGGSSDYTFTSAGGGLYTTKIPSKTPFLTFQAKRADGSTFTARTSLQGNDMILFDPTLRAGTGAWDSYVEPSVLVERELYKAHSIYYGSVIVKEYNSDGTAKNLGDEGSYRFAEAINKNILEGNFTGGSVNDHGRGQDYGTIHSWVAAYTELYSTMAKARTYISGHNYPEYIHNKAPDIYDASSIDELQSRLETATELYCSEGATVSSINEQTALLKNAINNVSISTSNLIPLIFYDTQGLVGAGATFEVRYGTSATDSSPKTLKVEYFNTEHCPIIFINAKEIYNVQFIVNGTDEGVPKDKISLIDGAWVYMDIAKKAGVTTSYWVKNSASDYRQISNTMFTQENSSDVCAYDMTVERTSVDEVISPAGSEDEAKSREYRPITLYFKNDVTVKTKSNGTYTIRAGAYTFEKDNVGTSNCPFTYMNTSNGWMPRVDLYSEAAKKYFEDPSSYWKYSASEGAVEATTQKNWVTENGDKLTITAGGHNSSNTVNFTVNDGVFASNREWVYLTSKNLYFRWEGNSDLKVNNTVTMSAKEIIFASSGTIDATANYNKHFYFKNSGGGDSIDVLFPTDIHVEYYDKYRDKHSFTIREGSYTIEKATDSQDFIADLCDEDYWESMVHVKINNRYGADGEFEGNGENTRFSDPVYTDDNSNE